MTESTRRAACAGPAPGAPTSGLMIGGFTMTGRHLDHYRHLYRELGLTRVLQRTPSLAAMSIPAFCERYARDLARECFTLEGGVHLHLFSGSIWIYYALNQIPGIRARVRSVVMESTPLDVGAEQFGRFAAWRLRRTYGRGWSYPFMAYRRLVGISGRWEIENSKRMHALPAALPILSIYSKADPVADPDFIRHYNAELARRGCRVRALELDHARHCLAMRDEPERYRLTLSEFLRDAGVIRGEGAHGEWYEPGSVPAPG